MFDEDESQRMKTKSSYNPSAFNVNAQTIDGNSAAMVVTNSGNQRNVGKPIAICSHCNMLDQTVDQCYKVHGYPSG